MSTLTISQDPNSNVNGGWPTKKTLSASTTKVVFMPQAASKVVSVAPLPNPPFSDGGPSGATYQVNYSHTSGSWTTTITWEALPGAGGAPPSGSTSLTLEGGG